MTVYDYMMKYNKSQSNMRVYVYEIEDEICGYEMERYYESEVKDVWDHNGDMIVAVEEFIEQ